MNRFLEILREEIENALSIGGSYASKAAMMQTFDRASMKALLKYAKEKKILIDEE